ncbi:succinylglutamate desuccinylase/aspartoacylase family protein [Candidatus Dojkabacteria bacterium]|jgi:hypothetical protein|nr:succinylglutamate desuccinylase/aspartoacylase family protein [Candidatus Dojkabacteria bacterium]
MKNIFKYLFFSVLFLLLGTFSIAFAEDLIVVTPTSNVTNNVISTNSFKIILDYSYDIVLDEGSNIQLFENDISVDTSYTANGSFLEISKLTKYLPKKTYHLVVANIKSSTPNVSLSDYDLIFEYTSFKTFEIGKTVKGRSIYGYSLGEGSQVYLLIGTIHGNEKNTSILVNKLMKNFKANPSLIPDDSKLVFVPILNVDGYIKNSRFNAHGVDLNRNSKTRDWQSLTYIGYTKIKHGGGKTPNSEPEIKAIQSLIRQYNPYLSITYHSAGDYVLPNGKSARKIAKSYSLKSKYTYIDQSSGGSAFEYKITGDLANWMYKKGFRGMTVELESRTWSEADVNFKALKYIMSYY